VSVAMVGGTPRHFIGARGGRGGGRLEGARSVPFMVVGGRFGRGTGEPKVGFEGGGGGSCFWGRRGWLRGGSADTSRLRRRRGRMAGGGR
jgi:hypothetical protein